MERDKYIKEMRIILNMAQYDLSLCSGLSRFKINQFENNLYALKPLEREKILSFFSKRVNEINKIYKELNDATKRENEGKVKLRKYKRLSSGQS